jgi:hypothetical protein
MECGKGFARSDYLSKHAKVHSSTTTQEATLKSVVDDPDVIEASPSMDDLVRSDDNDLLLSDAILPGPDQLDPFLAN